MKFIDANIILRYLTKDDLQKGQKCFDLFQKIKNNEIEVTTCEAVITEIVYVLSSKKLYNLARSEIYLMLLPILNLRGFKIPQKNLYMQALDLYASKNIDFEDALIFAHMKKRKIGQIYSYDNDFESIEEIKRIEP
jgi:uncharacterized protein